MNKFAASFLADEAGATALEYGLIVAVISLTVLVLMTTAGNQLVDVFTKIYDQLVTADPG